MFNKCVFVSPQQSLMAINNMIKRKDEKSTQFTGKRLLQVDNDDDDDIEIPPKRISLVRRLQDLTAERKEAHVVVLKG